MATAARKQDMPPTGGFRPINFERVPAKTYFSGPTMIAGLIGITSAGLYLYYIGYKKIERDRLEIRSSMNAITPLLLAERDRAFLKQLRKNRDEESKLMANVEGWETGTLYGEKIFKTLPPDTLVRPSATEFYINADPKEKAKFLEFNLWTP